MLVDENDIGYAPTLLLGRTKRHGGPLARQSVLETSKLEYLKFICSKTNKLPYISSDGIATCLQGNNCGNGMLASWQMKLLAVLKKAYCVACHAAIEDTAECTINAEFSVSDIVTKWSQPWFPFDEGKYLCADKVTLLNMSCENVNHLLNLYKNCLL